MDLTVILLVMTTAICFSMNALFIKLSSNSAKEASTTNSDSSNNKTAITLLAVFAWSIGALILGLVSLAGSFVQCSKNDDPWHVKTASATWAAGAGFLLGIGIATYIAAFALGADFSFATPCVNVTVVGCGVIFGHFLFGERMNRTRILGILLSIISVILLSLSQDELACNPVTEENFEDLHPEGV